MLSFTDFLLSATVTHAPRMDAPEKRVHDGFRAFAKSYTPQPRRYNWQAQPGVIVARDPDAFSDRLMELGALEDGWDGEDAPKPETAAIARAANILSWAADKGLTVTDVDADVLGGVAVWFSSPLDDGRRAWIACMNTGEDTLVTSVHLAVRALKWGGEAERFAIAFLTKRDDAET